MEDFNHNTDDNLAADNGPEPIYTEQDEREFLASLDDEFVPDDNGTAVQSKKVTDELNRMQGEASAMALLKASEGIIRQFAHSDFQFDEAQLANVAKSAGPLFVKYGGNLPPWLLEYKEEFTFVVAAGALGFTSVNQVRQLKAADNAKVVQKAKAAKGGADETSTPE
ncbi:hypothetical protein [Photobacterium halotolerans]|uniref:hypothetical protein n=1 Tax=Photobacterium halotolerans TaxID=265726 RepID=UPI0013735496|nr:hypothetical protein [Photobacterium halotolerans]NAW87166.1 hypothetical protein [Photobacterium halotolerans]